LRQLQVDVDKKSEGKMREMLVRCAGTALNSKLISAQKDFFSQMAVKAVLSLEGNMDLNMIGIKRVAGGSITDSNLVDGVAFKKTFAYAGFEQQPKSFKNPPVVLLNVELELKSESSNAEIKISDTKEYQKIVDAEWKIIYDKLDKIVQSGAKVVLSKLPIGDLATQYFADRNIFCAGRVPEEDLERVSKATGGVIQTSLNDLSASVLGKCGDFEEKQVGPERFNFLTGCPRSKAATIILRGGAEQFIAESERSLHDALMIVKRAIQHSAVVGGGGAIEMELSRFLRDYAMSIKSKLQMVISGYAAALEMIPRQLAENAGFDSTDVLNALRAAHARDNMRWAGVDIDNEGICDTFKSFVWEPALVKSNAISAATEAACLILSVDETVKNPRSEALNDNRPAPAPRGARRR
jgi:T-complex protein 1 subunit eta